MVARRSGQNTVGLYKWNEWREVSWLTWWVWLARKKARKNLEDESWEGRESLEPGIWNT